MARLADIGETKVRELLRDGKLKSITLGARRLIVVASYSEMVEAELSGPAKDARRNSAVPALGSKRRGAVPAPAANSEAKTEPGRRHGRRKADTSRK